MPRMVSNPAAFVMVFRREPPTYLLMIPKLSPSISFPLCPLEHHQMASDGVPGRVVLPISSWPMLTRPSEEKAWRGNFGPALEQLIKLDFQGKAFLYCVYGPAIIAGHIDVCRC